MDDRIREGLKAKGYSDDDISQFEKTMKAATKVAAGTAMTAVGLAGAGVVSLVKKDTAPISKTWSWCKKNFFGGE